MEKVRSPQFSGVRVCAESATDLTAGGCARIHDSNSFFFSSKPPNIFAVRLVFCVAECCSRARSSHCAGCVLQNNERKNTIRASNLYERIWKKYCTVLRNLTVKGLLYIYVLLLIKYYLRTRTNEGIYIVHTNITCSRTRSHIHMVENLYGCSIGTKSPYKLLNS